MLRNKVTIVGKSAFNLKEIESPPKVSELDQPEVDGNNDGADGDIDAGGYGGSTVDSFLQ